MSRLFTGELAWLAVLAAAGGGFALSRGDLYFAATFIALGLLAVVLLAGEKRSF